MNKEIKMALKEVQEEGHACPVALGLAQEKPRRTLNYIRITKEIKTQ